MPEIRPTAFTLPVRGLRARGIPARPRPFAGQSRWRLLRRPQDRRCLNRVQQAHARGRSFVRRGGHQACPMAAVQEFSFTWRSSSAPPRDDFGHGPRGAKARPCPAGRLPEYMSLRNPPPVLDKLPAPSAVEAPSLVAAGAANPSADIVLVFWRQINKHPHRRVGQKPQLFSPTHILAYLSHACPKW